VGPGSGLMGGVGFPAPLAVQPSRRDRSRRPRPTRSRCAPRPFDPTRPLDRLLVLVVEDDRDTRDLLRLMLEPLGATVLLAEDGAVGLDLLQSYRPDVILVDLMMPGIDGLAFAREVHRHPTWTRIPLLAVTALAGAGDYITTWAHGFSGHLTKPVEQDQLVASIRRVLRRR
jgi:CheY-like chemotaxis protein